MSKHHAAAAAQPPLSFAINPSQVFAGLSQTLTLTFTNTGPAVLTFGPRDKILLTFPADLVDSGDDTFTGSAPGFTVGNLGPTYSIAPIGTQTLNPQQAVAVTFNAVKIDATASTTPSSIPIEAKIGGSPGTWTVSVTKIAQTPSIVAWLEPITVGAGGSSWLKWSSLGGTMVTVTGLPVPGGSAQFPVGQGPPYAGKTQVAPPPGESFHVFTLVLTPSSSPIQTTATLYQTAPIINRFAVDPLPSQTPLPLDAKVKLSWMTTYAAQVFLATPASGNPQRVNPTPVLPLTVTPGKDVLAGNKNIPLPATATYTLSATGFASVPPQSITFTLAHAQLLYFKFADAAQKQITHQVAPPGWPNTLTQKNGVNVLTIPQPGGTNDTYYLGSADTTDPQIQNFSATPTALSWVTKNLTSLTLDPGAVSIATANIPSGSWTIPGGSQTKQYVLTGTGPNGTITSTLTLP